MNVIYILVGLPTSGKSTYIKQMFGTIPHVIISSDNEIEKYAKKLGISYNEAFKEYIDTATKISNLNLEKAIKEKQTIIVDKTNITKISRSKILKRLPKDYIKIAVVFNFDFEKFKIRNEERSNNGKTITNDVIIDMMYRYEQPTKEEGFNNIIYVDTFK